MNSITFLCLGFLVAKMRLTSTHLIAVRMKCVNACKVFRPAPASHSCSQPLQPLQGWGDDSVRTQDGMCVVASAAVAPQSPSLDPSGQARGPRGQSWG